MNLNLTTAEETGTGAGTAPRHSRMEKSPWKWVSGKGKNKMGKIMTVTCLRHEASGVTVELRHDSAHGLHFRNAAGVQRVDRFDASVSARPFLSPDLEKMLTGGAGHTVGDGRAVDVGDWNQGLNQDTMVLMLTFKYNDGSKVQTYLTGRGECIWYSLQDKVLVIKGDGQQIVTKQDANKLLR